MALFKPVFPVGTTSEGLTLWPSKYMEIPDSFYIWMDTVNSSILPMYELQDTGFEIIKQRVDQEVYRFNIMFSGRMSREAQEMFISFASATMGSGVDIEFKDVLEFGTFAVPIVFTCKWVNPGDFVKSNAILTGCAMQLVGSVTEIFAVGDYQKVIATPPSNLEWDLKILDVDADEIYIRIP